MHGVSGTEAGIAAGAISKCVSASDLEAWTRFVARK